MSFKSKRQHIENYRISLVNDDSHEQLWVRKFTRTGLYWTMASSVVVILAIFWLLVAFTPLRSLIPGYPNGNTKREAVQNALRADSLQAVITRWEFYSANLLRIVNGEDPVKIDSIVHAAANGPLAVLDTQKAVNQDSVLRSKVTQEERFVLENGKERQLPIEGMLFFTPVKGVVSQGYDVAIHPFVDISAPEGTTVMSVLDGTVIGASWNDESGFTISVQHSNDIVSVYKHNSRLLKKTGDIVSAGSPIATVGSTGALTTGSHLHFELWHKGKAVDPQLYIKF